MKIIGAYDGDVNLKKQQEAYLASKTAEESRFISITCGVRDR